MNRPKEFLEWAINMFGPIAIDPQERVRRFIEEAVELAHACGAPQSDIAAIAERVYSRPRGSIYKEIGQAQSTLEVLAENLGYDADRAAAVEFDRVKSVPKEEWLRRHAAKVAIGIAG